MNTINKTIDLINKKPIHARRQTAFLVVTSITAIIFIVWISNLDIGKNDKEIAQSSDPSSSPFSILKDNIVTLYASAKDGFKEANK